ncbi:MAG: RdgB/HAM1 family non-canonical purine NTP pyrophosphatase, partial [Chloroflexota bacterium]
MPSLLIASHNRGKARELKLLLQDLPYQLLTLEEAGIHEKVDEEGTSLEENARLKAMAYAQRSQLLTLAEDSGLEVEALGGEPGVYSSRYGGAKSDRERISLLLKNLSAVPLEKRQACFRSVIALAKPAEEPRLFIGECPGIIVVEPRGQEGFGYDPVFYLPEVGKTMAELPVEVKNQVSHRG